ncbi:MAG TPA: DUF58 domain-containing protein [Frankiaceae bacterium]|nr:DUF58 domain-containing protein [Frankiaceae bacterium]
MTGAADVARRADRLRQLELLVTRRLDGVVAGDHQGRVRGVGSEVEDARVYVPGDDSRRIDWNATARLGDVHVRDTIADRELETWLVFDGSASLDFGTATCEKRDLALAAAAAFAFVTAGPGNRIGAVVYDGSGARIVAPRSGRDGTLALLHTLGSRDRAAEGDASLAAAIRRCRLAAPRRGLMVVVSDLLDGSDWQRELVAASVKHDVVVAEVRDPREDGLPPVGLLTLVDPETGRRVEVQTNSRKLRARFAEAAAARRAAARDAVRKAGAAHLVLSTDRDWLQDLVRFTVARRQRR